MYYARKQRTFFCSWVVREFSLPTYHGLMYHVIVKNTLVILGVKEFSLYLPTKYVLYIMYHVMIKLLLLSGGKEFSLYLLITKFFLCIMYYETRKKNIFFWGG